jgi:serine/threonine protein kinase
LDAFKHRALRAVPFLSLSDIGQQEAQRTLATSTHPSYVGPASRVARIAKTPQQPQRFTAADTNPLAPPHDPIASLRAALHGHYEFERELGQGAFATVYLAQDLKHERKVAVKVLHADPTSETGELRFIREIRLLARLQHPNILPLHDSGHVEALLYYVMPYVAGETLRARINRERRTDINSACSITREVADALAYAHGQGVIHRDIKPENILLSAGHPILADFGIARAIDLAGVRQLTQTGMGSPGTPAYMSPEQLMGDRELDGRSDTYSLGCVFFEMLTGTPPFSGKEGFVRRFTEAPPSVSALRPDTPRSIDDVITVALARNANERYQTAHEFANALAAASNAQREPVQNEKAILPDVHRDTPANLNATQFKPPIDVSSAMAEEARRHEERRGWHRLVASARRHRSFFGAGTAAIVVIAVLVATTSLSSLRNTVFAPAIDSTRVAVIPFSGTASASDRTDLTRGIYAALSDWKGLELASEEDVADAVKSARGAASTRTATTVARSLGAGRFIWGQIDADRSAHARIHLIDVSSGTVVRSVDLKAFDPATYAIAVTELLKVPGRPATADGGDRGTSSYQAWTAYGRGHVALGHADLVRAQSDFAESLAADPNYAVARVWLAQVASWAKNNSRADWKAEIHRALTGKPSLSLRDSLIADGLLALSDKDYPRACENYGRLTVIDSSDFAAWYGLGECQTLDDAVIPDRRNSATLRFRTSYRAAVSAYQRAFHLSPQTYSWVSSARLERLLPSTPTSPRWGRDASGSYFMAYPSLAGDTIAFVPYAEKEFAKLAPARTLGLALDRNAQVRQQMALEWVGVAPENPDAQEALAEVLEGRGELQPGQSTVSAITALRKAQRLANSAEQKLRLAASEIRVTFKSGDFESARRKADSLLARNNGTTVPDAAVLAAVAGMVGKIDQMAVYLSIEGSRDPPVSIPGPLQTIASNYLARAALGVCDADLRNLQSRLDAGLESYVAEENRKDVRVFLESRALSLSVPCTNGASALRIEAPVDRLYLMQQAFARHNVAAVRDGFKQLAESRRGMRAGDISLDYIYQESWLRAAIGDTAQALRALSRTLDALPTLSAGSLKEPTASAATGRAMSLAADLAAASGNAQAAAKWAAGVVAMWKNADPPLQARVTRMKEIAGYIGANR